MPIKPYFCSVKRTEGKSPTLNTLQSWGKCFLTSARNALPPSPVKRLQGARRENKQYFQVKHSVLYLIFNFWHTPGNFLEGYCHNTEEIKSKMPPGLTQQQNPVLQCKVLSAYRASIKTLRVFISWSASIKTLKFSMQTLNDLLQIRKPEAQELKKHFPRGQLQNAGKSWLDKQQGWFCTQVRNILAGKL